MTTNGSKRLYEALLVAATVAITLVAALTAWAAQLGGTWLPVLVPFGLVLAVPVAALSWQRTDQRIEEPLLAPSSPAQEPTPVWTVRELPTLLGGSHEDHEAHPASPRRRAGITLGLLLSRASLVALLPWAIVLLCPLMMLFMMRGMGHDDADHDRHDQADHHSPPTKHVAGLLITASVVRPRRHRGHGGVADLHHPPSPRSAGGVVGLPRGDVDSTLRMRATPSGSPRRPLTTRRSGLRRMRRFDTFPDTPIGYTAAGWLLMSPLPGGTQPREEVDRLLRPRPLLERTL